MNEKLKQFYTNNKRWLVPALVAAGVFIVAQGVLLVPSVLTDNPLPDLQIHDIDLAVPSASEGLDARIVIPSAGIDVPIVWSTSRVEADLQKDLENGALRYPGTVEPGEVGNSFITAHSSDLPWKPGEYKQAFADLGEVEIGDEDIFVVYSHAGEEVKRVQFKATQKEIVSASDRRMIEQQDKVELTLVTCWPIGTNWRRLMVKAELVE